MLRQIALAIMTLGAGGVGMMCLAARSSVGEEPKPAETRVYEMRTYTTHDGRLPALLARFRDHTMRLFEKHGIRNGMYWVPTDEKLSQNTLIYILSYDSAESAKKSWEAFKADPEWTKVKTESEKDGPIVKKVDSVYMKATDFSPRPNP